MTLMWEERRRMPNSRRRQTKVSTWTAIGDDAELAGTSEAPTAPRLLVAVSGMGVAPYTRTLGRAAPPRPNVGMTSPRFCGGLLPVPPKTSLTTFFPNDPNLSSILALVRLDAGERDAADAEEGPAPVVAGGCLRGDVGCIVREFIDAWP